MKVQDIKTAVIHEVNDSYGARLIEQGKAVPCPAAPAAASAKGKRRQEANDVAKGQD